jgi:O-antigen ligase
MPLSASGRGAHQGSLRVSGTARIGNDAMMGPSQAASDARGLFARMAMAAGFFGLLLASYITAWTGGGSYLVAAMVGVMGIALVIRRPTIGIYILLTTFLFTYPAALRGVGNLTINNVLGLMLVPMMLYEMVRDNTWWVLRFKPFVLIGLAVTSLLISASFYGGGSEVVEERDVAKVEASTRAQGPALFETRDAAAKLLTRLAFLLLFVFFVRTNRDLQLVVAVLVAALLFTYFSIGTGAGIAGWGTGRLRSLGDAGGALYAGRNPNKLAYFALLVLTLLWYARRTIRSPILYPLWAGVTVITFIMIPLTASRSGMLNLLFFVLIVMWEGKFNYRKLVAFAVVAMVIVVQFAYDESILDLLLPSQTAARLSNIGAGTQVLEDESFQGQGSVGGRFRTAQSAIHVWLEYPLFGVGIGNFETERAATDPFGVVGPPHNSYLWALAEGGVVALVLYLWLFAWTIRRIHEIRWEYEARYGPMKLGWLVAAMRTVLIGFMIFSLFADMWYHDFFYIIMGMSLALIHVHDQYAETGKVPQSFRIGSRSSEPRAEAPRRLVMTPPVVVSIPKLSRS